MKNVRGKRFHMHLTKLFDEPEIIEPEGERDQGRSAELIAERNEHLFCRYIAYLEQGKLNGKIDYVWICMQLQKEFHISAVRIGDIIEENSDLVATMRRKPELEKWEKKYQVKWK